MAKLWSKETYLRQFRTTLADVGFVSDSSYQVESWIGPVSVEWLDESGTRHQAAHQVQILLPHGFPYKAPIVLSLDDPPLTSSWHLNPGPENSLCLWVPNEGWRPYYTARKLLGRIREWYHYYHTDSWPADSQMPDLHLYLENLGMVVTGNNWQPQEGEDSGFFDLWHLPEFKDYRPSLASTSQSDVVSGAQPESRLATHVLPNMKDIVRTRGVWFRVDQPFVPDDRLPAFLTLIDVNCGHQPGWAKKRCIGAVGQTAGGIGFPIALGYKEHGKSERWLFLWVRFPQSGKKRLKWTKPHHLSKLKVNSFQTAPASSENLLRRSVFLSQELQSKKVALFGVGALGSSIGLLLAKAGTGELVLIDGDTLMPGNVMRHAANLRLVGFDKTVAARSEIMAHNPDCVVQCREETWDTINIEKYIEECDLVIDATANHLFSLLLNEICVRHSMPTVFVAAHRRAYVGRVIIRAQEADPCVACYVDAPTHWSADEYPIIPPSPDETFVEDGCGAVTEEAVALDVEAVANLTARIAVKLLQKSLETGNLAILVNEGLQNVSGVLAEAGTYWRSNTALPECAICSGDV